MSYPSGTRTCCGNTSSLRCSSRCLWSPVAMQAHRRQARSHIVSVLRGLTARFTVTMVRNIASGRVTAINKWSYLAREAIAGVLLATGLFAVGYARVRLSGETPIEALAVSASLFVIVAVAVGAGALLPILFHFYLNVDSVHAGSSIQVVMDVLGVTITILLCDMIFSLGLITSSE